MKRKGGAAFDFVFVSILREKNHKKDNCESKRIIYYYWQCLNAENMI